LALELEGTNELLGFTGLNVVSFDAQFTPAVELGCLCAARPAAARARDWTALTTYAELQGHDGAARAGGAHWWGAVSQI
jgi:hypothetical protein